MATGNNILQYNRKKSINRGFLTGPICPIYGCGAVIICESSKWVGIVIGNYFASLFISILLAIILVTVLEYLTGFALEKVFNCKWWDYSKLPFNLHGYICLPFSLIWGLLAFVLLQVVHPFISELVYFVPGSMKIYTAALIIVYLLADTVTSIIKVLDLRDVILNYSNYPIRPCLKNKSCTS